MKDLIFHYADKNDDIKTFKKHNLDASDVTLLPEETKKWSDSSLKEIYKTFTSSVGVAQTEPETEEINYTNVIPATSKRVSSKAKAKATPATKTKIIKKSTTKTSTKTKGLLPPKSSLFSENFDFMTYTALKSGTIVILINSMYMLNIGNIYWFIDGC